MKGIITQWNDEKGFGFVTTQGKEDKVFVHIKSFQRRSRRPEIGDVLVYDIAEDEKKRLQAINIQFSHEFEKNKQRQQRFNEQEGKKNLLSKITSGLFLVYLSGLVLINKISFLILSYYLIINVWTYLAYKNDKEAAKNNKRRTPEQTLHSFSLFGGWIGALYAQLTLRHKSQKEEFRKIFWATVILHIVIFTILAMMGFLEFGKITQDDSLILPKLN